MAKNSEENEGKVFIGLLLVGVGVGYILSIQTDNWMYMGACAVVGLGLGFAAMPFVRKK